MATSPRPVRIPGLDQRVAVVAEQVGQDQVAGLPARTRITPILVQRPRGSAAADARRRGHRGVAVAWLTSPVSCACGNQRRPNAPRDRGLPGASPCWGPARHRRRGVVLSIYNVFRRLVFTRRWSMDGLPGLRGCRQLEAALMRRDSSSSGSMPDLRERPDVPRADSHRDARNCRSSMPPESDHRRRHDRGGHAGGSRRYAERARYLARLHGDEEAGPVKIERVWIDDHLIRALLSDGKLRSMLISRDGRAMGPSGEAME